MTFDRSIYRALAPRGLLGWLLLGTALALAGLALAAEPGHGTGLVLAVGTTYYFSGQGKLYLAERNASGDPGPWVWVGNMPSATVQLEQESVPHREAFSGNRLTDLELDGPKEATLSMTLEDFSVAQLILGLFGGEQAVTGTTITGETLPVKADGTDLVNNDEVTTVHPNISAVTIQDSAGTPATLTAGTHYTILDAGFGRIRFDDVSGFTQPFTIDYTHGAYTQGGVFAVDPPVRVVRFEGLNTAASGQPKQVVQLHQVKMRPLSELQLIGDDTQVASYTLTGSVQLDSTKTDDGLLGQFGKVQDLRG